MQIQKPKQLGILKFYFWILVVISFLSFGIFSPALAQQLPYYTQFKTNNVMLNPGVVGTKRFIDARMDYRMQWVGLEGAPVTEGVSLNSRIVQGTMGVGAAFYRDQTGPTRRSDFSLAYSFHAKFEDVELSVGAAGQMLSYFVDGSQLHMHIPYDNAIDLTAMQKKTVYDANAGAFLYNDRFHLGLSILDLSEPTVNYFAESDSTHKTKIRIVPHIYGSVGYNWSGDPNWIWENSLQVVYAQANPITVDYNLRIHYRQKVFGGIAFRLHDAVAFQAGFTYREEFHVSYSYDFITSPLRQFQSGSHEIMLVWSSNIGRGKEKKYDNKRFKRQKYGFMF
jgi:type IX secretion system PorP/SprF family membrane protein